MVIYLTHPVHGTKVAISEEEAIYDEGNGWQRFVSSPTEKVNFESFVPERQVLADEYFKRFGKKPHWKMNIESLKEALEWQQH